MAVYAIHCKGKGNNSKDSMGSDAPSWLKALLHMRFFKACDEHWELHKGGKNIFCMDCRDSLCQHCSGHNKHHVLQIRKYVYQDCVRTHDINKLIDCSKIQTYTVNGYKVLLLNTRGQQTSSRPSRSCPVPCIVCGRMIGEHSYFCSIACKLAQEPITLDKPSNMDDQAVGESSEQTKSGADESICCNSSVLSDSAEEEINCNVKISPQEARALKRKGIPRRAPFF